MSHETLDNIEEIVIELRWAIRDFLDEPSDVITALAETLQFVIDNSDFTQTARGGIISSLIVDMSENNKQELALNGMLRESLISRKRKTIH